MTLVIHFVDCISTRRNVFTSCVVRFKMCERAVRPTKMQCKFTGGLRNTLTITFACDVKVICSELWE